MEMAALAQAAGVTLDWLVTGHKQPTAERPEFFIVRRLIADADGNPQRGAPDEQSLAVQEEFFTSRKVKPEHGATVVVVGDAMAPDYPDGTTLIIDTERRFVMGDGCWVIGRSGAAVVRYGVVEGGGVRLSATNPRIKDEVLGQEAALALKVWGKVIAALVKV